MEQIEINELLALGFVDTSYYEYDFYFSEFRLITENFTIEISGVDFVEIDFSGMNFFNHAKGCKSIDDIKCLIRLFS